MKTIYTIFLFFFLTIENFAIDCYTNGNGTDWENPANWVDGIVPNQSQDNIYIQHNIVKSSDLNMSKNGAELIVSSGATLTINGNLKCNNKDGVYSIAGNLITTGNIQINKSNVTVLEGGSITAEHIQNTWGSGTIATLAIYDDITVKDITLSSCDFIIGDGVALTCDKFNGSNNKVNVNIGNNVTCNINEGFQLTGASDVTVGNNSTLNITDDFKLADNNTDFETGNNCTIIIGGSYIQTGKADATFGDGLQLKISNKLQVNDNNTDLIVGGNAVITVGNDFDVLWNAGAEFGDSLQFIVSGDVEVNGNNSNLVFGDDSNIEFNQAVDILWGGDATFGRNNSVSISGDISVKGGSSDLELNDNTKIDVDGSVINQEAYIILDNANLTIGNDYTNKGGDLELNETSHVEVYGDLLNNDWGSSDIDISSNSQLYIHGDLTNQSSADIDGNGSLQVDGEIINNGYINPGLLIINPTTYTWTGANDSDWSNAANWNEALVPSVSDNVIITITINKPEILNSVKCKRIVIEENAELTIMAGGTLYVEEDATFEDNCKVIIKDDKDNNYGQLYVNGAYYTGNNVSCNYERWLRKKQYHSLSSPVIGADKSLVEGKTPRFNFMWNEAITDWRKVTDASLLNGKAYDYYYHAHETAIFSGTEFFNQSPYNYEVTKSGPNAEYKGLNFIGNPYPFTIDADELLQQNSGVIEGSIWIWDEKNNAANPYSDDNYLIYNTYMGAVSSSVSSRVFDGNIAPAQGFFVKKTIDGAADIVFNKDMYSVGQATFFKSGKKESQNIKKIKLSLFGNEYYYNEIIVGFANDGTEGFDHKYDAEKRVARSIAMYTLINDKKYAIQAQDFISNDEYRAIYVGVVISQPGQYTFHALENVNLENIDIYLEDMLMDTTINIKASDYSTTINKGTYNNRFRLVFKSFMTKQVMEKSLSTADNSDLATKEESTKSGNVIAVNETQKNELNTITTSVECSEQDTKYRVYSFKNQIYVINSNNTEIRTDLYSVSGKKCLSQYISAYTVETFEMYTTGIYLLRIFEGNKHVQTKKLFIDN